MAVKKRGSKRRSGMDFLEMFMGAVVDSVGDNVEHLVENIGNVARLKRYLRKYFAFVVLSTGAFVMFLFGVAVFLTNYFGLVYEYVLMVLGIVVFLIAWAYFKYG